MTIDLEALKPAFREMTPAPWKVVSENGVVKIRGPGDNLIAVMHRLNPERAPISLIAEQLANSYALINAVNSFAELFEKAKELDEINKMKINLDQREELTSEHDH